MNLPLTLSTLANRLRLSLLLVIPLSLAACAAASPARALSGEDAMRGIWVTRWDYSTPEDIRRIMDNISGAGLNTVFFQVRGNGTLYYPSDLEPLDPAWKPGAKEDALAIAVREARARDLKIHAWMNVMPAWRGTTPSSHPAQIANARPEWLMVDSKKQRMKLADGYIFVTPSLPEVREHIASIAREIATKYDVDGVHLDYIRFPARDYSYDKKSLEDFQALTGKTPSQSPRDWDEFRRRQITRLVRELKAAVAEDKGTDLSAAVWGDFDIGHKEYLQDTEFWVQDGLLDFSAPMNYTMDQGDFERRLRVHLKHREGFPVMAGIGAYKFTEGKKSFDGIAKQMDRSLELGCEGYVLFAYSSFFPGHKANAYGKRLKAKVAGE